MPKVSFLIPVKNEGVNLKIILQILEATIDIPFEILVVVDSKEDDSIPVVCEIQKKYENIRLVQNTLGRGVAFAIRSGCEAAKGQYVLVIAADDLGPVLTVKEMVALMDQGYNLVSATRYAKGGKVYGGAFLSRLLSKTANRLYHFLGGSQLTDATVGIKMFRPDIFQKIQIQSRVGWAMAFELSIKSQLLGMKLGEVPIISINRFYGGESSFKPGPWILEYSKLFLWGLKQAYQKKMMGDKPS